METSANSETSNYVNFERTNSVIYSRNQLKLSFALHLYSLYVRLIHSKVQTEQLNNKAQLVAEFLTLDQILDSSNSRKTSRIHT